MTDDVLDRLRAVSRNCNETAHGHRPVSPAERLRGLADACDEFGIDSWDTYSEGGPVERLESEVQDLLGTEATAFFPSGIMAQQSALRVWCDRAGSRRVALPDVSHLLHHELDAIRQLHGLQIDHLTIGPKTATAEDLASLPGRLAAVLVELPLREAGCLLPSWDELTELSQACRDRQAFLHIDGARVWEAAVSYDRPVSDIAALADSIYVSFYKGLGGLSGCCLAGPDDFVAEAKRWRKRLGGTLYRMTPETVAGLIGLRDELPRLGDCLLWARALVAALPPEVQSHPPVPHTSTFLLYAHGDADAANERLIAFVETERLLPCGYWRRADHPGSIRTELAVSSAALDLDPVTVAGHIVDLIR